MNKSSLLLVLCLGIAPDCICRPYWGDVDVFQDSFVQGKHCLFCSVSTVHLLLFLWEFPSMILIASCDAFEIQVLHMSLYLCLLDLCLIDMYLSILLGTVNFLDMTISFYIGKSLCHYIFK